MKTIIRITLILSFLILNSQFLILHAQVAINSDGASPDASAMLDVTSSDKGVLIPRMDSTNRKNISNPATGLLVFDTDFNAFWYYNGTDWTAIGSDAQTLTFDSDTLTISDGNSIDLSSLRNLDSNGLILDFNRQNIVLDVTQEDGTAYIVGGSFWQSFTLNYSGYLDQLDVKFSQNISIVSGLDFTGGKISIFQGEGISGSLLAEKELGSIGDGWASFDFSDDSIALTSGDMYTFYIEDTVNALFELYIDFNNPYADGKSSYDDDDDFLFRVYNNTFLTFEDNIIQINTNNITDAGINLSYIDTLYFNDSTFLTTGTTLHDADGNTKIQVEESSNEDIIRFDLAGTEFMRLDSGRIEILNTGNSVFIGEGAGANDDYDENFNVFIGQKAGYENETGYNNLFLGYIAGYNNSTGYNNVSLGFEAAYNNTTGDNNIFIGPETAYKNTSGDDNVFIGSKTGRSNTSGSKNVFLGQEAGYNNQTGSNNIFLGTKAGYNETGSNKLYIENSNASDPLIFGDFDADSLQINGTLNINGVFDLPTTDGDSAQVIMSDGDGTLFWSDINYTVLTDNDNNTKIQVEESNNEDIIRFDMNGTEFMRLDSGRIEVLNTGESVFLGDGAGANDDYSSNRSVFIGYFSGHSNTNGDNNIFLGYEAGYDNTTGDSNIFIGKSTGRYNTTGKSNTFVGRSTGFYNTTGESNVFMGRSAGFYNETGYDNVYLGRTAGYNSATGYNNVFLGRNAGYSNIGGSNNIFIGYEAGYYETDSNKLYIENSNSINPLIFGDFEADSLQINGKLNINGVYNLPTVDGTASQILSTDGNGTLSWAGFSLDSLSDTDGDTKIQVEESSDEDIIRFDMNGTEFMRLDNGRIEILNTGSSVFIGEGAGANDDFSNNRNVFIGSEAGYLSDGNYDNVFIGYQAGYSNDYGIDNVFIGSNSGYSNDGANFNTFTGSNSGYSNTKGEYNTFYGTNSGYNNTEGDINTFLGYAAGRYNTTGGYNIFIGSNAGYNNETGGTNVYIGVTAGEENIDGDNNVYVGSSAGENNTDGDNNVYIGFNAGENNTDGDNNVFIGYYAGQNSSNSNSLYIENSNSESPLIYGDFENDTLQINGTLKISNEYIFPTIDGSTNQYLTTNGSGTLSWTTLSENLGDHTATQNVVLNDNWLSNDGDNEGIKITNDGAVGIGTTPTNGKLEINGYINNVINNYTYMSNVTDNVYYVDNNTSPKEVSIYASDRIVGKFVISLSDERIKDIQGISDSKKDLDILNQIQITDYQFKDKVREGNTQQKKVIAQQVAEVFPQAVEKQITEIIPDIYQTATIDENGWVVFNGQWTIENGQLQVGEKVQILFDDKKELLEVLEVNENAFRVKQPATGNRQQATPVSSTVQAVFVYGRQVHDFHTVDYQAISMLNVSATQQLAKENETLKKRVADLEKQLEKVNQLEAKLEALLNNQ